MGGFERGFRDERMWVVVVVRFVLYQYQETV